MCALVFYTNLVPCLYVISYVQSTYKLLVYIATQRHLHGKNCRPIYTIDDVM